MQPKARWTIHPSNSDVWTASLGVFLLYVETTTGQCSILANRGQPSPGGGTRFVLWDMLAPTPCDAPDLMRLCEEELARRLHAVADTVAGDELAPPQPEAPPNTRTYPVSCVQVSFRAYKPERASAHTITSYTQLCDTLDNLPPELCIERIYTDGERIPQIWCRIGVDQYSASLVRAGITHVQYYSRSQLQAIVYPSATCRVVQNPATTG